MTDTTATDCVVAGAGVVGLAAARALARAERDVVIVEAAGSIGSGVSSRSSEVIHAGLYYPPGSLKARLAVAGRHALYAYCAERRIPILRCGKLVVATDASQQPLLERIAATARANGVGDIRPLSRDEALALEPALHCTAALLSPSTGIVDSHALMLSLLGDAEAHGAVLALRSPLLGGRVGGDGGIELDIAALHGVPGLVNLFGVESPGLTAALAIGDEVLRILAA